MSGTQSFHAGVRRAGRLLGGLLFACSLLSAQQPAQSLAPLNESGQIVIAGRSASYLIRHLPVSSFPGLPEELIGLLQKGTGEKNGQKARSGLQGQDAHVAAVQGKIQERFGTKVAVRYHQGRGSIEIKFFNDDDLERILKVAGIEID